MCRMAGATHGVLRPGLLYCCDLNSSSFDNGFVCSFGNDAVWILLLLTMVLFVLLVMMELVQMML